MVSEAAVATELIGSETKEESSVSESDSASESGDTTESVDESISGCGADTPIWCDSPHSSQIALTKETGEQIPLTEQERTLGPQEPGGGYMGEADVTAAVDSQGEVEPATFGFKSRHASVRRAVNTGEDGDLLAQKSRDHEQMDERKDEEEITEDQQKAADDWDHTPSEVPPWREHRQTQDPGGHDHPGSTLEQREVDEKFEKLYQRCPVNIGTKRYNYDLEEETKNILKDYSTWIWKSATNVQERVVKRRRWDHWPAPRTWREAWWRIARPSSSSWAPQVE